MRLRSRNERNYEIFYSRPKNWMNRKAKINPGGEIVTANKGIKNLIQTWIRSQRR
jgi:hypothetical protein